LTQLDEPVLQHSGAIKGAMMKAMAAIMESAGFRVEDAGDEYRPMQLRILAGPPPGRRPTWGLRDDELALPGWSQGTAGDGTN
jgi:hypothetical protein